MSYDPWRPLTGNLGIKTVALTDCKVAQPTDRSYIDSRELLPSQSGQEVQAEYSHTEVEEGMSQKRILGLFDHRGITRHQNKLPLESPNRIPGPYGIHMLMDEGVDLWTVPPAKNGLHRKLRDVIEHRIGVPVDLAIRGGLLAARSDAVLALLEDKAVLPSLLKQWGVPPYSQKPLSVISCWWAEELVTGDEDTRKKIQKALSGIDRLYCFSRNQVPIFEEAGFPGSEIVPITFGVDPVFYSPGPATQAFQVVSAGIDRGRDYDSLVRAATLLPDVRFDIFTQPGRIDERSIPQNVHIHAPVTMERHRDNLRSASLVVIPTRELAYPTGQSVMLEAMGCGTCTAVTMTPAMYDYIEDGAINLALPAEDAEGIAAVIRKAMESDEDRQRIARAGRSAAVSRFSFERMWREIASSLSKQSD